MTKRDRILQEYPIAVRQRIKRHYEGHRFAKNLPKLLEKIKAREKAREEAEKRAEEEFAAMKLLYILVKFYWKKPYLRTQLRLTVYGHRRTNNVKVHGIKRINNVKVHGIKRINNVTTYEKDNHNTACNPAAASA